MLKLWRVYSTAAVAPSRPFARSIKLVKALQSRAPDPNWALLLSLTHPKHRLARVDQLHQQGITRHEFDTVWKDVLASSDLDDALPKLEKHDVTPAWVIAYLIAFKVRTRTQAEQVLHLVDRCNAQEHFMAPLLVIVALALARFNLLVPLHSLLARFLTLPMESPTAHFNLLLHSIATISPPSSQAAELAVSVLKAMQLRQLRLYPETYSHLLSDRFVTLQLTRYLRQRMAQEGITPSIDQLEAYLRVFSEHGSIHDAQTYFNAIRQHTIHKPHSKGDGVPQHANTLFMATTKDQFSAFQYLRELLHAPPISPTAPRTHRVSRLGSNKHGRVFVKQAASIHDLTAALNVAAFDHGTSATQLIRLFERTRTSSTTFRPSVVTFTVLLRGLYRRKHYVDALRYWDELLQSGLRLDSRALTIGLQILVQVNQLPRVLSTLEIFVAKPGAPSKTPRMAQSPVSIDVVVVNELMSALLWSPRPRPDIIFLLWDWMEDMYGVQPNSVTLDIVLQAARKAARMDDSLQGTVALLKLGIRRRSRSPVVERTRELYLNEFTHLVGTSESGTHPYYSGVWHERSPAEGARWVFHSIVLGNYPELIRVDSPALPYRIKPEPGMWSPIGELTQGLGFKTKKNCGFEISSDIMNGPGRYPTVVPTNSSFLHFIRLLGLSSRQAEVALALAWMRELNIKPQKDTLATALVFWSEVGMQAPLIEKLTGGQDLGEYSKLMRWIEEWVGAKGMPEASHFNRCTKWIDRMRQNG